MHGPVGGGGGGGVGGVEVHRNTTVIVSTDSIANPHYEREISRSLAIFI
jgi:hypothetical protein